MISLIFSILLALLVIGVLFVIIFDDGDPGAKLAWMLIITVLPVVGLVLYFAVGLNYRSPWYFKIHHQRFEDAFSTGSTRSMRHLLFSHTADSAVDERFRPLVKMLGKGSMLTVSAGNEVEVITNGVRKKDLLLNDLRNAKRFIHMEYFIFGDDKGSRDVKEILMQKAREGVKVRFIHENIANFGISNRYYDEMRRAGVEVVRFTHVHRHLLNLITKLNYRNHRKIVVIDGNVGYTGGMNINDKYFLHWRDTHMRISGPAVAGLQFVFMDSWLGSGGDLDLPLAGYFPKPENAEVAVPQDVKSDETVFNASGVKSVGYAVKASSDSDARLVSAVSVDSSSAIDASMGAATDEVSASDVKDISLNGIHKPFRDKLLQVLPSERDTSWPTIQFSIEWALHHAAEYIYIQTPYFVPPQSVLDAMKMAAMSGVDVRLMLPVKADNVIMGPANKAYFTECLNAGVRVFERNGEFIHAKTLVCDDYLSIIGTANMDYRSMQLNYEVNTLIYDREVAVFNRAVFLKDQEICTEVSRTDWLARPWYSNLIFHIVRLFAPLL